MNADANKFNEKIQHYLTKNITETMNLSWGVLFWAGGELWKWEVIKK